MVEEAMCRKPADAGAAWVVGWLLAQATELSVARQDAIMKELSETSKCRVGETRDKL